MPSTGEERRVGRLGSSSAGEHGGLGGEDLGKGALDEDDFEWEVSRKVGEKGADDFDGLAAVGGKPGMIAHQRFYWGVFEVAVRVVGIGWAEGVADDGVATGIKQAHDKGGAGAREAGDDD